MSGHRVLKLFFGRRDFADQFSQNHVAHGETDGGQGDRAVAELMNEVIVTAAAGERAQFAAAIERLKDHAGIVGEPADDPEIDLHEFGQTANFQRGQNLIESLAAAFAIENFEDGFCERAELDRGFLPRLAFALVDDLQNFLPSFFRHVLRAKEIDPEFAVAHPDDEVARGKTKRPQQIHAKRDRFHIRAERFFADDVGVELEMFPEPAALLFLVAETLRDRKPF